MPPKPRTGFPTLTGQIDEIEQGNHVAVRSSGS
jgi:hypothetical protein